MSLPVYRCGRGTTSLESFHLHLNRFIPGTAADSVNFQVINEHNYLAIAEISCLYHCPYSTQLFLRHPCTHECLLSALQAYLLDGVARWNADRARAAVPSSVTGFRTYDTRLMDRVRMSGLSKVQINSFLYFNF